MTKITLKTLNGDFREANSLVNLVKMKKVTKEWTMDAVWGKIAMVSWGDPANPPILMVHGYMDSAATFILLVEHLPDTHFYVAFDMPGHGKSDPFPPGLATSQLHIVEIVRLVVKHMKWQKFIYLSHSLGFNIGIIYNHVFPGRVEKMVHIDPVLTLYASYKPHITTSYWYQFIFENYYENYHGRDAGSTKELTFDEAVHLMVQTRNLSQDQAQVVISRALMPVGDGKYKLLWEPRMKKIATAVWSEETLFTVITERAPPTLILESSDTVVKPPGRQIATDIIEKCCMIFPNFTSITIKGGHDVHITNPEIVAPHIKKFLAWENSHL